MTLAQRANGGEHAGDDAAKDEASKALAQLKLSNDIVAARNDALRKLENAEDTKAAADAYATMAGPP